MKRIAFIAVLTAALVAFGQSSTNRNPTPTTCVTDCQQCLANGCICWEYGHGKFFCDCFAVHPGSR